MITPQAQIKVNLPFALKEYLASKAQKFDMPIAGYVRHLILADVADLDYPTFTISEASEKKAKKALVERKKSIKVSSPSEYFKKL